jgi:uncharacterized protein (TIGR03382 family)
MRPILLVSCLAIFGLVATAEAHFKLNTPAANLQQSAMYGDPQKVEPCGGAGVATNAVTEVRSGAMLSISITETIGHKGHYRVALAPNMAGLPANPTVTDASCNGLQPSANPTLPILGDGLFKHTTEISGVSQTFQVMIPAGMTCTNCILQVIEYMYPHGQPCFYHHCATVNISPSAPLPPDAGIEPGADAGTNPGDPGGGGGCSSSHESATTGLLGSLAIGLLLLRRRRRARG